MSETNLLPCPFCGGEATLCEEIPGGYIVQCCDCCAQVGIMTKDRAIAVWNTRATSGQPAKLTAEMVEPIVDRNCEWYEGGEIERQQERIEQLEAELAKSYDAQGVKAEELVKRHVRIEQLESENADALDMLANQAATIKEQLGRIRELESLVRCMADELLKGWDKETYDDFMGCYDFDKRMVALGLLEGGQDDQD